MDLAMKLNDERQAGIREERMDNVAMMAQELQKMGLNSTEMQQRLQHIFHGKLSTEQIDQILQR